MVGQVGTLQMSGVSIVNNLFFIFNLCIFGACSGAGIFTAQFHGSSDHKNIRNTFRFKIISNMLLTAMAVTVFLLLNNVLISLYLRGEGDPAEAAKTLDFGIDYLKVMLWGLLPFALSTTYASTLRECGQTKVPMIAGVCAVVLNLVLNYILIFGHLGLPAMGVRGAALATVISRYVELAIVAAWTHLHHQEHPFIRGAYRSLHIPSVLLQGILKKGSPLLLNEFLWACSMAIMNQSYSTCGLNVVPAMNISSTMYNLSSVVFMAMGISVGIIMGQMMGAGEPESVVRDHNRKLITASVISGVVFSVIMLAVSGLFPRLYNTNGEVRHLATRMICISALLLPVNSYTHATYFTLRSGGQTMVTFLFDSCFQWLICVPLAFFLSRFTSITILPLYFACQSTDLLKSFIGFRMLKQGKWIRNLTQ
jgi:putative MATE family efflux protein